MKTKKIKLPKAIKPESFKKLWKTKKATENIEPIILDIIKEYRPKVHKPQWSVTRKDLADRVFSEYVRLYYADKKWYCKCVTCWQELRWEEIQAWHYRTRGYLKYRFEINQVYPQCYTCNVIKNGYYRNYKMFMDKTVWPEQEDIYWNDNELVEYNQIWYEEHIIERYSFIKDKKILIWDDKR